MVRYGPGSLLLETGIESVTLHHFRGVAEFTEAQGWMVWDLYGSYKKERIPKPLDTTDYIPDKQRVVGLCCARMCATPLTQEVRNAHRWWWTRAMHDMVSAADRFVVVDMP